MDFLMLSQWLRMFFILLLFGLTTVASSCGPGVGPSSPWVKQAEVQAAYPLEVVALPSKVASLPVPIRTLRVTTFNVHYGEDVEGVAEALLANENLSRSSVFLLQEIRDYPLEGSSRTRRLAEKLGMAFVYAPAKQVEGGTHGIAILSSFPLENIAVMELPAGELLINNERRIALAADISISGKSLHFINVHLDTRLNSNERIMQLRPAILDAPNYTIVAGDFNTNPLTWALNTVPVLPLGTTGLTDQSLVLDSYMRSRGMSTPTADLGSTVNFPILHPRLDSIYLLGLQSGGGAVERQIQVSDHWPLWLEIFIPKEFSEN